MGRLKPSKTPPTCERTRWQLVDRRRVAVEIGVGEEARADSKRARRAHAAGDRADRDLRGGAADVDHRDVAVGRMIERAGCADERQPRLLLVAEHLDLDAAALRDRARELVLVGGLADRRGGHRADRLGAELAREPHLRARRPRRPRAIFFDGIVSSRRRPFAIRVKARCRAAARAGARPPAPRPAAVSCSSRCRCSRRS